jgi:DNA-binding MarR family transcriptional regulator
MIDRLEKDGLVTMEIQPSSSDRRFKKVFITRKGLDFIKVRIPERRRLMKEATAVLMPEDMQTPGRLLPRLRKHLLEQVSK